MMGQHLHLNDLFTFVALRYSIVATVTYLHSSFRFSDSVLRNRPTHIMCVMMYKRHSKRGACVYIIYTSDMRTKRFPG